MHCNDALFYHRFRRPGTDELEPTLTADLDRHLAGCAGCSALSITERAFDAAVGNAMNAVPIPIGLRSALISRAVARRSARQRHIVYRYAGVAATVLLALAVGFGVFRSKPQFELYTLLVAEDSRAENPEIATKNWLSANGLPSLPEAFDFSLAVNCAEERIQGNVVPVVVFRERQGEGFAKVFLVRESQFDFQAIARDQAQASHCTAYVHPRAANGYRFVIVHTGPSLTPFLRRAGDMARSA